MFALYYDATIYNGEMPLMIAGQLLSTFPCPNITYYKKQDGEIRFTCPMLATKKKSVIRRILKRMQDYFNAHLQKLYNLVLYTISGYLLYSMPRLKELLPGT